jgi:hypothetical protein
VASNEYLKNPIEGVYPQNFHSKLTDSDALENSETQVWLEFSFKYNYN